MLEEPPVNPPLVEVENFAGKVFNFSWSRFGLVQPREIKSHLYHKGIGQYVVCLQIIMRENLKRCFSRSMDLIINVTPACDGFRALRRILQQIQPSFEKDVPISTLSLFALISELVLFLDSIGYSVPFSWIPGIWTTIYKKNIQKSLIEQGGWSQIIKSVEGIFEKSDTYERFLEGLRDLQYPYQPFDPLLYRILDVNVFAVREFGSWLIESSDILIKVLKDDSLDAELLDVLVIEGWCKAQTQAVTETE